MNPKEAKKILPKKEYETFEAIFMNQISRTPAAKLKLRATMARRLRDKYIDLAKHQVAEIRTRRTNETDTDINDRRAGIFQEVIDILENELDRPRITTSSDAPTIKKKAPRAHRAAMHLRTQDKKAIHEARRRDRA
jgi:ATP-dependent Clp protease ATP-binding subunit ClpA